MKQLSLEVGKSYRNRTGKVVKITKKYNDKIFNFLGDTEFSYTITGLFTHSTHKEDLIEEVTETLTINKMRPTDEELRKAAEAYSEKVTSSSTYAEDLFFFAKSLFKETEQETFDRIIKTKDFQGLAFCEEYHKERTRIENE
jgi:hypothetical protein